MALGALRVAAGTFEGALAGSGWKLQIQRHRAELLNARSLCCDSVPAFGSDISASRKARQTIAVLPRGIH